MSFAEKLQLISVLLKEFSKFALSIYQLENSKKVTEIKKETRKAPETFTFEEIQRALKDSEISSSKGIVQNFDDSPIL